MDYKDFCKLTPFEIAGEIVKTVSNRVVMTQKIWYDYVSSLRGPGGDYTTLKKLFQGFLRGSRSPSNFINCNDFEVLFLSDPTHYVLLTNIQKELDVCSQHYINHVLLGLKAIKVLKGEVELISKHLMNVTGSRGQYCILHDIIDNIRSIVLK